MITFDNVSKSFRVGRAKGLKDLILGSHGMRSESRLVHAVRNVTFTIGDGESIALLGHNGAGKSTILKLLAGTILPSEGSVISRGRIAPLLELGAGFHPDLTGRENIFMNASVLGLPRSYVRVHLDEIIEFSGLEDYIDMPVRFYSSGMYARLGFSVAVHVDPEILLIDEVLAVGDAEFQARCLQRMGQLRGEGRSLVLVTHSTEQSRSFSDRVLVLDHGRLIHDGSVGDSASVHGNRNKLP
jgi:ABC-2 type transport system ATP-binding protein